MTRYTPLTRFSYRNEKNVGLVCFLGTRHMVQSSSWSMSQDPQPPARGLLEHNAQAGTMKYILTSWTRPPCFVQSTMVFRLLGLLSEDRILVSAGTFLNLFQHLSHQVWVPSDLRLKGAGDRVS